MTEEEILVLALKESLANFPKPLDDLERFALALLQAIAEIEAHEAIDVEVIARRASDWLKAWGETRAEYRTAALTMLRDKLTEMNARKVREVFPRDRRALMAWFDANPAPETRLQ
jgi:hypothetical protein